MKKIKRGVERKKVVIGAKIGNELEYTLMGNILWEYLFIVCLIIEKIILH